MKNGKVEIMYFYSNVNEDKRSLSRISKKIGKERKDIQIRLVNIDDPGNDELAELYQVNAVPLLVFLTPKGEIAAKQFISLSSEEIVNRIADKINNGELPNPQVEEIRTRILHSFRHTMNRNEIMESIAEQIENDLVEANTEPEIYGLMTSHVSAVNHMISDLQELKRTLQRFAKEPVKFII